jgi:hypothetical protein
MKLLKLVFRVICKHPMVNYYVHDGSLVEECLECGMLQKIRWEEFASEWFE